MTLVSSTDYILAVFDPRFDDEKNNDASILTSLMLDFPDTFNYDGATLHQKSITYGYNITKISTQLQHGTVSAM